MTLLCLLLPLTAAAANLRYTLSGLSGEPERNVRAWLGDLPETERERQHFVALARSRAGQALQALGYYGPVIELAVERTDPTWTLELTVDRGTPVTIRSVDISVAGEATADPEFDRFRAAPGLDVGDVLHHGKFEELRSRLLSLAQRRGYFDATFTHSRVEVDVGAASADVRVALDSGRRYLFGELRFDPSLVDGDMLADLRGFKPGTPYLQSELRAFQARVQGTGYYSAVLVEPEPAAASDGRVPIDISLQSAERHSFDVGVGYSTDTEERIALTWRTPRINRFGHSQQSRIVYSRINPSGRISYNIPLTHPLNDMLQLWGRLEENEFGDLDSQQDELGLRRELRRDDWVIGFSARQLTESSETLGISRTNDYLLPGVSLSHRRHQGSLVDPRSGLSQLYTLEVADADAGSDVDLLRITGQLRYVHTLAPRHRLVGRTELGFADIADEDRADLAPSLNFFAGGNQSIRGFSYQSIGNEIRVARSSGQEKTLVVGGDRLAVFSLEYQYYFTQHWRAAMFADGGDAFDSGAFDWHYGAGLGIHYISPVGAVRFELANSLSEHNPQWQFHLNIGAEF